MNEKKKKNPSERIYLTHRLTRLFQGKKWKPGNLNKGLLPKIAGAIQGLPAYGTSA